MMAARRAGDICRKGVNCNCSEATRSISPLQYNLCRTASTVVEIYRAVDYFTFMCESHALAHMVGNFPARFE